MLEIILTLFLFIGLSGIGVILFKKIPILLEMPESTFGKEQIISTLKKEIKRGIKIMPGAKKIDYELYLQKVLSKIRVLTFKVEGKTGNWLEKLRQKRNGHNHDNDHDRNYWEELKKAKKGK